MNDFVPFLLGLVANVLLVFMRMRIERVESRLRRMEESISTAPKGRSE